MASKKKRPYRYMTPEEVEIPQEMLVRKRFPMGLIFDDGLSKTDGMTYGAIFMDV